MSENDHCLRTSGEQLKFLKLAIKGCKLVKENKKITQSERGVRIRLLVAASYRLCMNFENQIKEQPYWTAFLFLLPIRLSCCVF